MSYFNLGCIIFLFVGVVVFFYWAFEYGKTYGTSLPMPTKTPPMPMIKPTKPWSREGANINEAPDYTKPKPPPNPPKIREICCCCKRPMSKYWKELED